MIGYRTFSDVLFKVSVPEGELDGLKVERFIVPEGPDLESMRLALQGRPIRPGTYTRLTSGGTFWMSDTPAEADDHYGFFNNCERASDRLPDDHAGLRLLVNGLGLGCLLNALLHSSLRIDSIDVVECDQRVLTLCGKHYEDDPRVTFHHADAYEQCKAWPVGTRWDGAWHDIWPDLCVDNLGQMARLHRSYGRRVGFQDSWGKEYLESIKGRGGLYG